MKAATKQSRSRSRSSGSKWASIRKEWGLYLMLIPGLVFLLIFKYTPMYGLVIAFQDFSIFRGISGSEWVGLKHFEKLMVNDQFLSVFRNTVIISVYKLIFLFPAPIIIAILLNEIRKMMFKKVVQSIIYLPHFISWVIVSGLFINLLSLNGGIVNTLIEKLGGEPIGFFMDQNVFRPLLVVTEGWKEVGWGTIVYLAAISSIDPQLYEAAKMDGANKFQQMWHVTLPGMASTIVLMLILRLGSMLEAGTEQILVMYNPVVYNVADVIGTYVYRVGLGASDYSFSTAVGLFESVVAFTLVVTGNFICRKYLGRSIW
ncbi:Maltose transport system permease protein malF [Chlamydia abortus]|uniref:ABC transporter permease n=1 Tax=Paenibacillus residui TaxID=629724 RepID=A0ABW3DA61_9BACL|nr:MULTISPECIES: ABC transporter permease subunit [Paenibacillaceae]SHE15001.1 Maltose transport system permease protein malF [Chlamydia abortus]